MSRYIRQQALPGFSQATLTSAHVAVIGAGGLGSPALLYLAGAGVGKLTIIDDDVVSLSNLHRQVIHTEDAVGSLKTESAARRVRELNSEVDVRVVEERLTAANALGLLEGVDVVVDGTDNFDARHVCSWACARLGIPHVWASILGFDAQMSVFWAGRGPVYEDVFPEPPGPGEVPNCAQAGVLGPIVGVVGAAMAMEALKILTGLGEPLVGRLGYYSSLAGTWEYIPVVGSAETVEQLLTEVPASQGIAEVADIPEGAVIIDVREADEVARGMIPGAAHYPLGEILDGLTPPELDGSPAVVYCAAGVRSARAVDALQKRGVTGLASLRGGYENWATR